MEALFGRIQKYCFQGHTHLPGVFTEDFRFVTPEDCSYQYRLEDKKVMVNVGSVGQPRDGDPRACYVILEDGLVTFRRLEYPVEETRRKIYNEPDLDNALGDRLISGR
jgi:diadenosine tetraphosphatase ApaH/serine/threonine PP2A family protein phosphatase